MILNNFSPNVNVFIEELIGSLQIWRHFEIDLLMDILLSNYSFHYFIKSRILIFFINHIFFHQPIYINCSFLFSFRLILIFIIFLNFDQIRFFLINWFSLIFNIIIILWFIFWNSLQFKEEFLKNCIWYFKQYS